tara:strand:+ start:7428 stop:8015 length:588 start_codon:yes stop_codon:yes gene_type:complete
MKESLKKTKRVYGVGINDTDYTISTVINGKRTLCPFYRTWTHMLERCYCPKYQERSPTYKGCSVSKEWLIFSNFRSWMVEQNWESKQLDKDILIQNNKVYGPETCLFVTNAINNLLIDKGASRGEWPIGVCFDKRGGKYVAQCSAEGKNKNLGYYNTPKEASDAYKLFKYELIAETAIQQTEPLRSALLNYMIEQ